LPENSDEKVARVLQIYHQLGIRQQVETAIDDEFAQAKQHLDAVQADEALKRPLRELTATLSGRKK
jgi:geranylgeranyl pyrophosphate synthase